MNCQVIDFAQYSAEEKELFRREIFDKIGICFDPSTDIQKYNRNIIAPSYQKHSSYFLKYENGTIQDLTIMEQDGFQPSFCFMLIVDILPVLEETGIPNCASN
jgi:hypothetical protein